MTGSSDERRGSRRKKSARLATLIGLVLAVAASATVVGAAGTVTRPTVHPVDAHNTKSFWTRAAKPVATPGRTVAVHAARSRSLTLDTAALRSVLALAPGENTLRAETSPLVVSLPAPNGRFQLFALHQSSVMAPGLAARHPGIKTYSGLGLTDQAATIHADLTPLGFHASVRSANGTWYIDPFYVGRAPTPYASYYAHDAKNTDGVFVERAPVSGPRFNAAEHPEIGEQLRTYRLALITDPGYSDYFGGPPNVTPAKVALMNRVDQVYEDDMSIRLQLIPNNDLLNLDTWGQATAPNGPCGAAACFTQAQVTGCSSTTRARYVVGQIIGASNYDIGHLALGEPGGGVANLGVVGRSNKAGGCTGVPTPVGDLYAIDYVAHEMGHQFGGDHTFNGNQLNCSGGNRNGPTSVEPGSGQSIMAYAGICLTDDEQPHSDGYFSERSQQEINGYVSSSQSPINEVQTVSLRHFGGGNETQIVTFGPGYAKTASITPLSLSINSAPSAGSRGGAQETGTTVTIATSNPHTLQVGDTVTVSGVAEPGYNGTFTVMAVPSTRSFQYTNSVSGLPVSGGGTVTPAIPGASSSGTTATIHTSTTHGRSVGDIVVISGVGVGGYNGTFTITAVPSPTTFQYTIASQQANSGGGSATYYSPFKVRIGGNDSALIGGTGLPYSAANLTAAINAISGFAGTVTVTSAAATGFNLAYSGASAGVDVPNIQLVELNCGCFASVEETNHGGALDSFRLNYDGNLSASIVNGTNYTAAGSPGRARPAPSGGRHGDRHRVRRRGLRHHRLPDHLRRHARLAQQPGADRRPGLHVRRVGVRGRDRQGRPGRQRRNGLRDRRPSHRWSRFRAARRSRCERRSPSPGAPPTKTATRSTTRGSRTTRAAEQASRS